MSKFVNHEEHLTYDDVLVYPAESASSRQLIVTRQYQEGIGLVEHPVIPANMDTIMGPEMVEASLAGGGLVVNHRYQPFRDRVRPVNTVFASMGVSREEIQEAERLTREDYLSFCIDVAHGHSAKVCDAIRRLKQIPGTIVMAGNIATPDGFLALARAGADIVKVGVGPGSHCTTRLVAGCGVPQLSAVLSVAAARDKWAREEQRFVALVADGGIRWPGDIVKAIIAGADYAMSGSLFAGCPETGAREVRGAAGGMFREYRGMASREAQNGWFGSTNVITPEGETSYVKFKPSFGETLAQILGGLRSGMSYAGCDSLNELRSKARFIKVSANTLIENRPHGVASFQSGGL